MLQVNLRANGAQADLFEQVPQRAWMKRFCDFNVWTAERRIERLRYMHRNPVRRGLVESPELWRWSSYRSYFYGETGLVRINGWGMLKMKIGTPAA